MPKILSDECHLSFGGVLEENFRFKKSWNCANKQSKWVDKVVKNF